MGFDCTENCNKIPEVFNCCIGWNAVTQIQPWPTVIEGVFATLVIDVCFNVCNDPFFHFGKAFLIFSIRSSSIICLDGLWDGLASLCGYYPWFQYLQKDFHSHLASRNLWICHRWCFDRCNGACKWFRCIVNRSYKQTTLVCFSKIAFFKIWLNVSRHLYYKGILYCKQKIPFVNSNSFCIHCIIHSRKHIVENFASFQEMSHSCLTPWY